MRQSWSGRATASDRSITCSTSARIAVVAICPAQALPPPLL